MNLSVHHISPKPLPLESWINVYYFVLLCVSREAKHPHNINTTMDFWVYKINNLHGIIYSVMIYCTTIYKVILSCNIFPPFPTRYSFIPRLKHCRCFTLNSGARIADPALPNSKALSSWGRILYLQDSCGKESRSEGRVLKNCSFSFSSLICEQV